MQEPRSGAGSECTIHTCGPTHLTAPPLPHMLQDIKPSQLLGLAEVVHRSQLYSPPPGQPAEGFRSPNMHPPHAVPRPLFHYEDINIASLAGLAPHIEISPQVRGQGSGGEGMVKRAVAAQVTVALSLQIPLLVQYPQMKPCVRQAVEKAVQDYANPVLDRSIKIVLTTTEQVIKKVLPPTPYTLRCCRASTLV